MFVLEEDSSIEVDGHWDGEVHAHYSIRLLLSGSSE